MPFYFRNISYINSYDGEHCIGNLGHVKWLVRDGICSIRVFLQGYSCPRGTSVTIHLLTDDNHIHRMGEFCLCDSFTEKLYSFPQEDMVGVAFATVSGLYLTFPHFYAVSLPEGNRPILLPTDHTSPSSDRWQRLLHTYPVIHPLKNEMDYLSISPKDISILPEKEQPLAHNSFLLHGYYNYHHIILGQYHGQFCIGVPGTYHRREAMVARMFGFPEFEEVSERITGSFGYYMTQILL